MTGQSENPLPDDKISPTPVPSDGIDDFPELPKWRVLSLTIR